MSIELMIKALSLEVAEIRKRGGSKRVDLRGGERIGVAEGNFLYRFPLTEELQLRDETPVQVECGQEKANGMVVSSPEGFLIVALERDLGPRIATARLIIDDSFLIERLRLKLEEISQGRARFNLPPANRVIGASLNIHFSPRRNGMTVLQNSSLLLFNFPLLRFDY
jgi:hypothetical protein